MSDFKIGDLVQFIPENFDRKVWRYVYVGIGYIEGIQQINYATQSRVYEIFCGKVIRQQMNNFAELELRNTTIKIHENYIKDVCKKATIKSIQDI